MFPDVLTNFRRNWLRIKPILIQVLLREDGNGIKSKEGHALIAVLKCLSTGRYNCAKTKLENSHS